MIRMRSENDRDSNVHQIMTCPSNGDTQSPRYSTPGALVKAQSRQLICTTREYTGTINFDWGRFLEKSNLVWKGSGVGNQIISAETVNFAIYAFAGVHPGSTPGPPGVHRGSTGGPPRVPRGSYRKTRHTLHPHPRPISANSTQARREQICAVARSPFHFLRFSRF